MGAPNVTPPLGTEAAPASEAEVRSRALVSAVQQLEIHATAGAVMALELREKLQPTGHNWSQLSARAASAIKVGRLFAKAAAELRALTQEIER